MRMTRQRERGNDNTEKNEEKRFLLGLNGVLVT